MKRWLSILITSSAILAAQSAAAEEGGIPQMDPTWFPNQLFWLALSFGLLFAIVSLFIAPRIHGILGTRENAIREAIADAERAKFAAEVTSGNVASASESARIKAAEIMAALQAEISAEATKSITKLTHDLDRKADHASAVLADMIRKANSEIDVAVQDLADAMAQKILAKR